MKEKGKVINFLERLKAKGIIPASAQEEKTKSQRKRMSTKALSATKYEQIENTDLAEWDEILRTIEEEDLPLEVLLKLEAILDEVPSEDKQG